MRSRVLWRAPCTNQRRSRPRRPELARTGAEGMARAKQFTVSHENLPGMLAHIAKVLGDAQVNILAFVTTASGREGLTHLIVDRSDTAKKAFAGAGLAYNEPMCSN